MSDFRKPVLSAEGCLSIAIGLITSMLLVFLSADWFEAAWKSGEMGFISYTIGVSVASFCVGVVLERQRKEDLVSLGAVTPTSEAVDAGATNVGEDTAHQGNETSSDYPTPEKEAQRAKDLLFLAGLTQDQCHYLLQATKVEVLRMPLGLHYKRAAVNALVREGLLSLDLESKKWFGFSVVLCYVLTREGMRLTTQYEQDIKRLAHDPDRRVRLELFRNNSVADE